MYQKVVTFFCVSAVISTIKKGSEKIKVTRSNSGDEFSIGDCTSCTKHFSYCNQYSNQYSCCNQCKCTWEETFFNDRCYGDLNFSNFNCTLAMEGSNYYGLKAYTLNNDIIGHIMYYGSYERNKFTSCKISDESVYWDNILWKNLFTNGRKNGDFFAQSLNDDGVVLKFSGSNSNLYFGLLIKFTLTCERPYSSDVSSCLTIKVAGEYNDTPPLTLMPYTPTPSISSFAADKITYGPVKIHFKSFVIGLSVGVPLFVFMLFCFVCLFCQYKRNTYERFPLNNINSSYKSNLSVDFEEIDPYYWADISELKSGDEEKTSLNLLQRPAFYKSQCVSSTHKKNEPIQTNLFSNLHSENNQENNNNVM